MIIKQDIINSALLAIGDSELLSSSQTIIDLKYKVLYQQLASIQYWNFLQTITDLGFISDTYELYGYKFKYIKPSNSGNIYSIFSKNIIDNDYRILGNYIYSNMVGAKCQYTNLDEFENVPTHFANCLTYLLASQLCLTLGKSESQPTLIQLYNEALREAKLIEGKDIPSIKFHNNYYSNARY